MSTSSDPTSSLLHCVRYWGNSEGQEGSRSESKRNEEDVVRTAEKGCKKKV